jgi:DNA helicase-2/ATP-dependent DNA helicase PcrA
MLRILDNPHDELAWHRVLVLLEGIGPATIRRVLDAFGPHPVADLLDDTIFAGLPFPPASTDDVAALRATLRDCHDAHLDPPPAVQVERIAEFLGPIIDRKYDSAPQRKTDLEELTGLAGNFPTRSRLLSELTLDPPAATGDLAGSPHLDDDWLVLSTIHSAKGGEWRVVHVIHASDGNIPSDMALSEPEGLEEERRLLYVAMTRAKDSLYITYPQRYYIHRQGLDDLHTYGQPSRFLVPAFERFERSTMAPVGASGNAHSHQPSPIADADPVGTFLGTLLSG